jgi:hypothetical protein
MEKLCWLIYSRAAGHARILLRAATRPARCKPRPLGQPRAGLFSREACHYLATQGLSNLSQLLQASIIDVGRSTSDHEPEMRETLERRG